MQLSTRFPLATIFFKHWSTDDREVGIVIAKARLRRHEDGAWRAEADPELTLGDSFADDPANSALVAEQDLAPGKIGTDLILKAVARSPGNEKRPEWPVQVSIRDRLFYEFQVRGPAVWTRARLRGWHQTPPNLVSEVPLTYGLAFGGMAPGPDGEMAVHHNNPAGIGFATPELLSAGEDFPAPQIGLLADFLSGDPRAEMTVCGLGPVAKAWLPRRALAGTFDDTWKATRHPRMPRDYSLQFWNAAPPALQLDPPLRGDEQIAVTGIAHGGPVTATLPGVTCTLLLADGTRTGMVLDTVTIDLSDQEPTAHVMELVWRATVDDDAGNTTAEIIGERLEDQP